MATNLKHLILFEMVLKATLQKNM